MYHRVLQEKLEMMRVECDEMRRREKQYMEQCEREADLKIQVTTTKTRGQGKKIVGGQLMRETILLC